MSNTNPAAESFDFLNVEPKTGNQYLEPGQYYLNIVSAKFEQPEGNNAQGKPKTPFLVISVAGKMGQAQGKIYISPSEVAMQRLEYLHRGICKGKKISDKHPKPFKSSTEVGEYFVALLNHDAVKAQTLRMVIGGNEGSNGKIYSDFAPFCTFFIPDEVGEIEEGPFTVGSASYNNVVQKYKGPANPSTKTDDVILPSSNNDIDSLPF